MMQMVQPDWVSEFQAEGFAIARGLFSADECDRFTTYFTDMLNRGGDGWAEGGVDFESTDPWRRYPRLLQPHRGDKVAFDYMLDPRVAERLTAIVGEAPLAVQTMFYFKPAGAKGQNMHQDNLYLLARPGTCLAAWLALDDCDDENGCMRVVPGSHKLPMLCQFNNEAVREIQWGTYETPTPPGMEIVNVEMKQGDVLFFNGSLIHGSGKNVSRDRFRRTLIGHYITPDCTEVAKYYFPVYRMDGTVIADGEILANDKGGSCGVYSAETGELAMSGTFNPWGSPH